MSEAVRPNTKYEMCFPSLNPEGTNHKVAIFDTDTNEFVLKRSFNSISDIENSVDMMNAYPIRIGDCVVTDKSGMDTALGALIKELLRPQQ